MAVGAQDMTVRIYALEKFKNFSVCSLGGMTDPVVGAFFEADSLDCYTVSSGGQLAVWESSLDLSQLEPGQLVKTSRKKKQQQMDAGGGVSEEHEEEIKQEETEEAGGMVETLEAGEKSSQASWLIYKRGARHFLRQVYIY